VSDASIAINIERLELIVELLNFLAGELGELSLQSDEIEVGHCAISVVIDLSFK